MEKIENIDKLHRLLKAKQAIGVIEKGYDMRNQGHGSIWRRKPASAKVPLLDHCSSALANICILTRHLSDFAVYF